MNQNSLIFVFLHVGVELCQYHFLKKIVPSLVNCLCIVVLISCPMYGFLFGHFILFY